LTANPKIRAELLPGQVIDITPRDDRGDPQKITIAAEKMALVIIASPKN
jgi:hypothetical protein